MKKFLWIFLLLAGAMFFITFVAIAEEVDQVTIWWDRSIDFPYLDPDGGCRIYYGTASGDYDPAIEDRASHYSIDDGVTWISTEGAPPPISVGREIVKVKIKGLTGTKVYYFMVTVVDTRGIESEDSDLVTNNPELKVTVTGIKNTE